MSIFRSRIKLYNIVVAAVLMVLFLAGMNFRNQYYYFVVLGCVPVLITQKKIAMGTDLLLLLVISVSWLVFSPGSRDLITSMIKPFMYPLAYLAGFNFLSYYNKSKPAIKEKKFVTAVTVLALGPFAHYILNMVYNLDYMGRNTIDVWTNSILSATNQAAMGCLIVGVAVGALFSDKGVIKKLVSVGILAVVMMYNLRLAGRTLFVIIAVAFVAAYAYVFAKRKDKTVLKKITFWLLISVAGLFILYYNDIFSFKALLGESNFFGRFFGSNKTELLGADSRWRVKIAFLKNFPKGVLGGAKLRGIEFVYAHDIILDTYDEAGIFALLAMVTFLYRSFAVLFRVLKRSICGDATKVMLVAVYTAISMQFMVEPILQGVPWLFALFCFIHGMLAHIARCGTGDTLSVARG